MVEHFSLSYQSSANSSLSYQKIHIWYSHVSFLSFLSFFCRIRDTRARRGLCGPVPVIFRGGRGGVSWLKEREGRSLHSLEEKYWSSSGGLKTSMTVYYFLKRFDIMAIKWICKKNIVWPINVWVTLIISLIHVALMHYVCHHDKQSGIVVNHRWWYFVYNYYERCWGLSCVVTCVISSFHPACMIL